MANPLYGQNKFDNSADAIIGEKGVTFTKRNVINIVAQTDATSLTAAQTGSLIMLSGTPSQIQVINLPTVKPEDVGIFYEFFVDIIGNSGAAGSYTINTGGHATDDDSATAGYDDFHPDSSLLVAEGVTTAEGDVLRVGVSSGDGTMILADNTTNAVIVVGSRIKMTAIAASTIGTASGDVWLVEGQLNTSQATGFVTTNLFTAP